MIENPITLEEERKVWSIHQSVNGVTYYYNRATKKSQYEMPECFKTTEQQTQHPDWKQYRTAQGKKFYYNALTRKSNWQLPNQVKQYKRKIQEQKRKQKEINGTLQTQQKLSQQEEIKKKIISLFKAKSVNINTKWQSCIKMCEDDQRWTLMKISEKKKIFNDYIIDLKKLNEMQKKAKTQINKTQFLKMLKQAKFLNSDSKMHKVAYDFLTDPRWRILQEIDKENTFQDYIDELWNKQKQFEKQNKQRNMDNLRLLMQNQNIKYNMKWDDFRSKFRNYDSYKNLHPYERITVFSEYIMEAEKKHEEETLKEKRLRERYNRINFRNLLKQKLLNEEIGYKTKWRQFVSENKDDKNLLNMMDPQQQGSTAHQIFQNFMFEIRNNHKTLKSEIKQHFKKKQFKMTEQTPIEQFQEKLSDLSQYTVQKDYIRTYIYKYFVHKIKSKNQNKQLSAKKALKKEKKLIFKIFKQLKDNLKTKYSIEDHMEKIEQGMKQNGISISHQSIFKYYLAFLEGYDEQKRKKQDSRSKSSDRSSVSSAKPKKRSKPETEEQTNGGNLKKFNIPAELKNQMLNDMEEQGQIKDDEVEDEKKQKKKTKHKKKRKNSYSDSD